MFIAPTAAIGGAVAGGVAAGVSNNSSNGGGNSQKQLDYQILLDSVSQPASP
jgi:hypothetical protein